MAVPINVMPSGKLLKTIRPISIAAERYVSEFSSGLDHVEARRKAFEAALIPLINSLLAVGLVSLPGMMTGQVLAGISPLIAVRYQILVMCMLFGSSGIAVACYLYWSKLSHRTRDSKEVQ